MRSRLAALRDDPPRAAVLAASAALFAPLFYPLFTGRMFVALDLGWFHIPVRYLYASALAGGDSILWTPALFRGFYVHGEGQLGAMHPLHLLLYRWLPLETAVSLELIAIYALAFAGMRQYLRLAGLGAAAASFGGLLYAFSGFNLLHLNHANHLAVAAHMPWLVAGVEALVTASTTRRRSLWFGATAATVGSAALFGSPQFLAIACLVAGGYAAVRMTLVRAWSRLPLLAAAVATGAAIGAAQLLPSLDFLARSNRSAVAPDFATTFSLHPLNLLQLVAPYVFAGRVYAEPAERAVHELSIYNGAFCTIAIAWLALGRQPRSPRLVAWLAIALSAAGVALALGRHGGVYRSLLSLPLIDRLRAPARFIVVVHFGLAAAGAVVFDWLARPATARPRLPWRWVWPVAAAIGISGVTAVVALRVFAGPGIPPAHAAVPTKTAFGFALVLGAAGLVAAAARQHRAALAFLPLFTAADLAIWGYRPAWQPPLSLNELALTADVPEAARPGAVLGAPHSAASNLAVLRDEWLTSGYAGIVAPRALWPYDVSSQRLSGAEWTKPAAEWKRVSGAMPPARLVVDARVSDDVARDILSIDVARTALVDRPLPALSGAPVTASIASHRPGRIVVDVKSDGPALLVLTESYDAGWMANDGERDLPIVRVYGDYLGAVVPSGERAIAFTFAPPAVRRGLALSALGVLAAFAGAVALSRRRG